MSEGQEMQMQEIIEAIAVAYTNAGKRWVRIEDIVKAAGISAGEMAAAVKILMADDTFRAEPQPFGHRITTWDRVNAPNIGGEARHLICWE